MIKYIIFDAYGTLISTGTGSIDATRKILEDKNVNVTPEVFYNTWKMLHRKHIDNLTLFCNEEKIFLLDLEELYKIYNINGNCRKDVLFMLDTLGKRTAFEEVNNVLNILSKSYTLCIGSTTDNEPLFSDLQKNNINIKNIFTSESMQVYKPEPEFYNKILDKMGADINEVLFVGDSLIDDVLGPQKLGIKTCWVNRKKAFLNDSIKPDYIIGNLNELLSLPIITTNI